MLVPLACCGPDKVGQSGFKYFIFSPLVGEMIQFDEHIFQIGWSHQLDEVEWRFSHEKLFCGTSKVSFGLIKSLASWWRWCFLSAIWENPLDHSHLQQSHLLMRHLFCRWLDATCSPWPLLPLLLGFSDNDFSGSLLCTFSAFLNEGLYSFLAFYFIKLSFLSPVGHWYPALFQKRRLRFLSDDVGKDPKLPCIQIWWGWCLPFSSAFPNSFYFWSKRLQCPWKVHWIIHRTSDRFNELLGKMRTPKL